MAGGLDPRRLFRLDGSPSKRQRRIRSEQTREGLERARARGTKLGRPSVDPAVRDRIVQLRSEGMTFAAIAALLNGEGVPRQQAGAQWWASTVQAIIRAAERDGAA